MVVHETGLVLIRLVRPLTVLIITSTVGEYRNKMSFEAIYSDLYKESENWKLSHNSWFAWIKDWIKHSLLITTVIRSDLPGVRDGGRPCRTMIARVDRAVIASAVRAMIVRVGRAGPWLRLLSGPWLKNWGNKRRNAKYTQNVIRPREIFLIFLSSCHDSFSCAADNTSKKQNEIVFDQIYFNYSWLSPYDTWLQRSKRALDECLERLTVA